MASSKEEMDHKLTFRKYEEGDYTWGNFGDQIFKEDTSHKCPTYVHRTPPCQGSCPSGEDIRGWLQIVRGIETGMGVDIPERLVFLSQVTQQLNLDEVL